MGILQKKRYGTEREMKKNIGVVRSISQGKAGHNWVQAIRTILRGNSKEKPPTIQGHFRHALIE